MYSRFNIDSIRKINILKTNEMHFDIIWGQYLFNFLRTDQTTNFSVFVDVNKFIEGVGMRFQYFAVELSAHQKIIPGETILF